MWCDETTVYVAHDGATIDNKVFAYTISSGSHDSSKDFEVLYISIQTAAENAEKPRGAWFNGTTVFVVDNVNPNGMWFGGRVLWVVGDTDDSIYLYNLPEAQPDNTPAAGAPWTQRTIGPEDGFASRRTQFEIERESRSIGETSWFHVGSTHQKGPPGHYTAYVIAGNRKVVEVHHEIPQSPLPNRRQPANVAVARPSRTLRTRSLWGLQPTFPNQLCGLRRAPKGGKDGDDSQPYS